MSPFTGLESFVSFFPPPLSLVDMTWEMCASACVLQKYFYTSMFLNKDLQKIKIPLQSRTDAAIFAFTL